jgi:transglutaminase-like putative cysteine protease
MFRPAIPLRRAEARQLLGLAVRPPAATRPVRHLPQALRRPALAAALLALVLGAGAVSALAQEPPEPADDEAFRVLIEAAGDREANGGAERVIVYDRTDVRVEESGLAHIEQRVVTKALSEAGATALSRLRFDYDPASNVIEVRALRLHRAGGETVELPLSEVLDLPQPQDWIIWGPRMKLVQLPRLTPGDAVEWQTYKKGFMIAYLEGPEGESAAAGESPEADDSRYIPPMRGHYYDVVTFQGETPIKLKLYTVTTPRDKPVQFEVYNGAVPSRVSFTDGENRYAFWTRDAAPFHEEPLAAEASDQVPKVVLATVPDWGAKSRWFFETNEWVFAADEAIQAKVEEITRGLKSDEEKIAAILHWSADEIRYSGITMGQGEGYTIHPGSMTFADRAGVCKDKAGMCITMLRAAGIPAFPAMTMAGSRVERVPADQFNHCVVAVKAGDGYRMIDPTWAVFSPELWSSAESEQHYLIGSAAGEELMITPLSPPEKNRLQIEAETRLLPDGSLEGTLRVSGTGYVEQRLRRMMVHSTTAPDRRSLFEDWVGRIDPRAELLSFTDDYAALRDVTRPVAFQAAFRVPGYAVAAGERLILPTPSAPPLVTRAGLAGYLGAAGLEEREQPLFLWCPSQLQVRERLRLPAGWRVENLPDPCDLDGPAASLAARWTDDGDGSLLFEKNLSVKLRTLPTEQYKQFREVIQALKALPDERIVLRRGEEQAARHSKRGGRGEGA